MKKTAFSILGIILVGAILFGWSRRINDDKNRRLNEVRAETAGLRVRMKTAYAKRGDTLRAWTKGARIAKDAEFNSLLVENDGLELKTQPEFDRYDWVQEQLNRKITLLLTDKKLGKKKPKEWESVEREVADARAAYAKRALSANRRDHLPEHIPLFRAEEALAPDPAGE